MSKEGKIMAQAQLRDPLGLNSIPVENTAGIAQLAEEHTNVNDGGDHSNETSVDLWTSKSVPFHPLLKRFVKSPGLPNHPSHVKQQPHRREPNLSESSSEESGSEDNVKPTKQTTAKPPKPRIQYNELDTPESSDSYNGDENHKFPASGAAKPTDPTNDQSSVADEGNSSIGVVEPNSNTHDLLAKAVRSAGVTEETNEQINDQAENLDAVLPNQSSNEHAHSNDQSNPSDQNEDQNIIEQHFVKDISTILVATRWREQFPCDHCGRQFLSKKAKDRHVDNCKKNGSNTKCDICGKHFLHVDAAKKHKVKHWSEDKKKEFQCLQCNVQCTTLESKQHHDNKIITGIFYQCSCGKKFCYHQHLKIHQDTMKRKKKAGHDKVTIGAGYFKDQSSGIVFQNLEQL